MEYTNLLEPFGVITISILIGGFFGAYWMFLMMYKTEKNLVKELDAKNKKLNLCKCKKQFEDKYVDNDPCRKFDYKLNEFINKTLN